MSVPVIDTHCHLFDPARYPYRPGTPYRPAGQEIATLEQMRAVFAAHNVQRALLVQPNSGYDTDLSCMLDAIAASDGTFKGVASVPPDVSEAELWDLKARGVAGIAFNAAFHGVPYYTAQTALLEKLPALGLFLQVQSEKDQLLGLLPMLRAFPGTLVIDHCGRPEMDAGLDSPAFQAVLALGREKRAWIKLSGYAKFSRQPWPHRDVWPYLDAIKAAFGADRCLWASDWPFLRAAVRVDYGPLLTLAEMLFPASADRSRFLWHNAAQLCGFVTLPA